MRLPIVLLALAALPAALPAQSFEGSKWSIEQEGVDTVSLWWFGSQGRVRTGDVGTILPGYKWRQVGDSIYVTVGDTLQYHGQLISSRFVGIRSGARRQEGWWSGSRADAPTTVAEASSGGVPEAAKPASASTEEMNRPVEPSGGNPAAAAPPRTLRRIERADGSGTPSSSTPAGGREIRRIQRGNASTTPVPTSVLVGRWVQADSGGVVVSFDFKDDGSVIVGLNTGNKGEGSWSHESDGTRGRHRRRPARGGDPRLARGGGAPVHRPGRERTAGDPALPSGRVRGH